MLLRRHREEMEEPSNAEDLVVDSEVQETEEQKAEEIEEMEETKPKSRGRKKNEK